MIHSFAKRVIASAVSLVVLATVAFSVTVPLTDSTATLEAEAVSLDYPPQLMNLSLYDNSKNLASSNGVDQSVCILQATDGSMSEQWRIDYCGANSTGSYYKIVGQDTGRLLTPYGYSTSSGTDVVIYGNENDYSQYWYILPVAQDNHGNDLYYKIVNYADPNMALTSTGTGVNLTSYSGTNAQKWLLNCAGLIGFAGYCYNDNTSSGAVKAGDIGGVLGETVEVSTFDELKNYATASAPYTIVITGNISIADSQLTKDSSGDYYSEAGRIYVTDNKTIIGSYSNHSLYNVALCTKRNSGVGNNVIFKNLEISHSADANGNDNIQIYFSEGQNLWVDHVTFVGHNTIGTSPTYGTADKDKFLACCYNADYCSVTSCSFGYHEYGVIMGYPDDSASSITYDGYPNVTMTGNNFACYTRGPGLLRWGYYHSLNNYVHDFSMAYTVSSKGRIFAECCTYENGGNVICDWNDMVYNGYYSEEGSSFSNCNRTDQTTLKDITDYPGNSEPCDWRPITNYAYKSLTAASAKSYCANYAGAQSSKSNMNYTDAASAGYQSAGYMTGVENPWGTSATETLTVVSMPTNVFYQITNVNSGQSLNIADGSAVSGANVQQWSASSANPYAYDTFRFVLSDEDGYYYIQSEVGDKTLVLDVTGGKTDNGTNIELYAYRGNDNQKFQVLQTSSGTYKIVPKISSDLYLEVTNASFDYGANVALWEDTGSNCQEWTFTEVDYAGETMDTSVNYIFQNANSLLYMEVADASDIDYANVQQWDLNGTLEYGAAAWSSWKLKVASGDLYYIVSNLDGRRYLTIDNDNLVIKSYDSSYTTPYMMRFIKNPDGSYLILTRDSIDKTVTPNRYTKALEVNSASLDYGANIGQWEVNGYSCQNWNIQTFADTVVTTTTEKVTTTTTTTTTEATTISTTTSFNNDNDETPMPNSGVYGDLNGDGVIDMGDVVVLGRYTTQSITLDSTLLTYADLNCDGEVGLVDLEILLQFQLGDIRYLPVA